MISLIRWHTSNATRGTATRTSCEPAASRASASDARSDTGSAKRTCTVPRRLPCARAKLTSHRTLSGALVPPDSSAAIAPTSCCWSYTIDTGTKSTSSTPDASNASTR